jgi:hypothetical protein
MISNSVSDVKDAVGGLADEIEINVDNIKNLSAKKGSLCHHIGIIGERLNGFDSFIATYSNENWMESQSEAQQKIERQESNIQENCLSIQTMNGTLTSMMAMTKEQHRISVESALSLDKEISKRVEDNKNSLNHRVDTFFQEKDMENDEIRKNTDISLGQINSKLTDLFITTAKNKESINNIESDVKTSQSNIDKLTKTTVNHDKRLDIYSSDIGKLEIKFRSIVDDMTKSCFNFIIEKHQELVRECIFL